MESFARFFVMPQTVAPVPNGWDRLTLLFEWVERGVAPGMSITVTAGENSLPLCSYPTYPKYASGPTSSASSYQCSQ